VEEEEEEGDVEEEEEEVRLSFLTAVLVLLSSKVTLKIQQRALFLGTQGSLAHRRMERFEFGIDCQLSVYVHIRSQIAVPLHL